ncbi:LOW QUALITY PROTEIN: Transposable element P transposase, partial [Frankliniella fusca]
HFFGHIRGSGGCYNHPDPIMFIQIDEYIFTDKAPPPPPRGSNDSGVDTLETLLKLKDLQGEKTEQKKIELESMIEMILDGDMPFPEEEVSDLDLLKTPIDHFALTVFTGYIASKTRKIKTTKECEQCAAQLVLEPEECTRDRDRGGLLRPTDKLFKLTFKVTEKTEVHAELLWTLELDLPLIGCEVHKRGLT